MLHLLTNAYRPACRRRHSAALCAPSVGLVPVPPTRMTDETDVEIQPPPGEGTLADGMRIIGEFVRTLPRKPGVYRMIAADGEVLYVGKARSLRNRVAAYTQPTRL